VYQQETIDTTVPLPHGGISIDSFGQTINIYYISPTVFNYSNFNYSEYHKVGPSALVMVM